MRILNMENKAIFAQNFESERQQREIEKYGRQMNQNLAAYPHRFEKHSIEPAYGNYDRPINEIV